MGDRMTLKALARRLSPPQAIAIYKAVRYRIEFGRRDHRGVFQKIHDSNLWGSAESVSGGGSTLAATAVLRDELARWLKDNDIKSFVDIPCGDFNWMSRVEFPPGAAYTGLDLVPEIVEKARAEFSGPNRQFQCADILESELVEADVYFCKDMFIHFPNAAIAKAIDRVRPKARFILATTFPQTTRNVDIKFGEARRVNMEKLLGPPVEMLKDFDENVSDRFIGVWRGDRS